jgi:hypothetical protein
LAWALSGFTAIAVLTSGALDRTRTLLAEGMRALDREMAGGAT